MSKLIALIFLLPSLAFGQGYLAGPGNIDVNIQDQHTRALDLRFIQAQGAPTTLAVEAVIDANTITLTSAVGFVDGSYVGITDPNGFFFFAEQLGPAVGNVITLDSPLDYNYMVGATVLSTSYEMNVNGSVTPQVFQIGPVGGNTLVDITRVMGYMQSDSSMDDSEFGGIAALTNGCVFRVSDGTKQNIWNVKKNGDIALIAFDFSYSGQSPAGEYGARFRITYAGQEKHGVSIRLEPGDTLEFIIQDDLTGMDEFHMMAQGHIVD